jgi:hypothetical protein
MNQYLADMRANQYAKALINSIKESTGFDLKIKVLKGDNFYGQGDKRGEEFRKIVLSPNADTHKVEIETKIDGTKTSGKNIEPKSIPWNVPVYVNGKGTDKKGYRVWDSYGNGTYYLALSLAFPGKKKSRL